MALPGYLNTIFSDAIDAEAAKDHTEISWSMKLETLTPNLFFVLIKTDGGMHKSGLVNAATPGPEELPVFQEIIAEIARRRVARITP
jgi:hypothetical protein